MIGCAKWARCTTTTLEEQTLEGSETEEAPQSANCPSPAQHQIGETLLGLVNRKLCAFIQTFPQASLLDKGWQVWCRGVGGVRHQHWHSGGGGTDHTSEAGKTWLTMTSSTPPLLVLDCKLTTWGCVMEALAHSLIFGVTVPSWIQMPWNSWHSQCRGPYAIVALLMGEKPCSTSYLETLAKTPGNGLASASPQCKHVKLFKPPRMSNTWHKRQNSV